MYEEGAKELEITFFLEKQIVDDKEIQERFLQIVHHLFELIVKGIDFKIVMTRHLV